MNDNSTKCLIPFLRNLADSIEQKQLLPRQLQHVGEFFMEYHYEDEYNDENESLDKSDEFDPKELTKFIVLGWYIYSVILKRNNSEDLESYDVNDIDFLD